MIEIKHFKVKVLPSNPEPNSIYFVVADGATAVTTYVTDVCGVALPLVDLQGSGGSGGCCNLTGTGVTGTQQNPIVNISTFLSSENGNLITLSTVDGKLYLNSTQDNKVIYFYPTLTELGVDTLEEVTETHIATWIQNEGIVIAEDEIPLFKVKLELYPIYFDTTNRPNENGGWDNVFELQLVDFYATKDYTVGDPGGATVYTSKSGDTVFTGDNSYYKYSVSPEVCFYRINNLGKIIQNQCIFE